MKVAVTLSSRDYDAVLFDLDGVLTRTASVHAAAWLDRKPAPDAFLEAARRVGAAPSPAVVVEDAIAGVAAGRAGGFGCVIGVPGDAP